MRKYLYFIIGLIPVLANSQSADTSLTKKVDSLIWVSRTYAGKQNFNKALEVSNEAKHFALNFIGKDSGPYCNAIMNSGWIKFNMGLFSEAESDYIEAKDIRERLIGKQNLEYSYTLGKLAILYSVMGEFEKAESYYLEAKPIIEKVSGRENLSYAASIENLAILYRMMGKFEKAEPLFIEAKNIQAKKNGLSHPNYANSLYNLGNMYMDIGLYKKAEPLYLEAKSIDEKILGSEHSDYAQTLNSLGILYFNMLQFERAEPYFIESKKIREKVFGQDHPEFGSSLINLATLYGRMGRYKESEKLFLMAKEVMKKVYGEEHPTYAVCINDLGNLYIEMGEIESGKRYLLEAKEIREKILGKIHPDYCASLRQLAKLYYIEEQFNLMEPLLIKIAEINRIRMQTGIHHLSEYEMGQYLLTFNQDQNRLFSFVQKFPEYKELNKLCFDNILLHKGFLLNAYHQIRQMSNLNPLCREQFLMLKSLGRKIAAEYSKPVNERINLDELLEKSNILEKEVAQKLSGYSVNLKQVNWQDVKNALHPGEVAVEFVHYNLVQKNSTDSVVYAALIVRYDDSEPHFIYLTEEKILDNLLNVKSDRKADYVNSLYTLSDRGAHEVEVYQKSLHEIL